MKERILKLLPYSEPFLFVKIIDQISEEGVTGSYTFREDEFFYKGHFDGFPITPGVILTEVAAQIGLVCQGIYLELKKSESLQCHFVLTSSNMDFLLPVYPGTKVIVKSEKIYYRLGKLKSKVTMTNEEGGVICRGEIAGMKTQLLS